MPNLKDLQHIPNAVQPTGSQGLTLPANGVLPPTVLASSPTDGYALTYDSATNSSVWGAASPTLAQIIALGAVTVYDRATTTVDVASTLTETSIYTKSITGGDMSTNRTLRLTTFGDFLHNNVAGDTATLKVKFGGTTHYAYAFDCGGVTAASRHPWWLQLAVSNLGAANSQMIAGHVQSEMGNAAAPTTGIGVKNQSNVTQNYVWPLGISTLGTIDTTTAQTLDVTITWSASSANNSWRMRYAVLELV